jgi:ribosome biogenesis GTPase A
MRVCVVGMPNVGKSSLINWLVGRKRMKVGDRPGITKAPQWLRIHPQIELLDTPGVLPNVSLDKETLLKLSLLNLLSENTYDAEQIANSGLALLSSLYIDRISDYFGSPQGLNLEVLARKRNFIGPGGKLDTRRAATSFLTDLREGKLGSIMLDTAPPT